MSHREGDERTTTISRGEWHGGKVLPPCSGLPCNPKLSLRAPCRETVTLWAWPLPRWSPCNSWGSPGAGHAQHSSDKPSWWGQKYGWGKQVLGECYGIFNGEYQLNWPQDASEVSQWKAMEAPCCPASAWRHFLACDAPSMSLTPLPPRNWLHWKSNLSLVITAVGEADMRSVVNTSEITSLA